MQVERCRGQLKLFSFLLTAVGSTRLDKETDSVKSNRTDKDKQQGKTDYRRGRQGCSTISCYAIVCEELKYSVRAKSSFLSSCSRFSSVEDVALLHQLFKWLFPSCPSARGTRVPEQDDLFFRIIHSRIRLSPARTRRISSFCPLAEQTNMTPNIKDPVQCKSC